MQGDVHDPRAWSDGRRRRPRRRVLDRRRSVAVRARAAREGDARRQAHRREATFESWIARRETSSGGRALGWDRDSRFASHRSSLLSTRAFGHGGFTGTAMWIDPGKDLYVVFLSNRVHPDGKGAVNPLVAEVATLAIDASETKTGIDVLRAESFERLKGAHVGLVTNASARAKDGTSTIDTLRAAPNLTLSRDLLARARHPGDGGGEDRRRDVPRRARVQPLRRSLVADVDHARRHRHARLRPAGRRRALLHVRVDDEARDEGRRGAGSCASSCSIDRTRSAASTSRGPCSRRAAAARS